MDKLLAIAIAAIVVIALVFLMMPQGEPDAVSPSADNRSADREIDENDYLDDVIEDLDGLEGIEDEEEATLDDYLDDVLEALDSLV
jgi:hypothetical protein